MRNDAIAINGMLTSRGGCCLLPRYAQGSLIMSEPNTSPDRLKIITAVLATLTAVVGWCKARVMANARAFEWMRDELNDVKLRLDDAEEQIAYDTAVTKAQQGLLVRMRDTIRTVMQDHNELSSRSGLTAKYTPSDWAFNEEFAAIEQDGHAAAMHVRHQRIERKERKRRTSDD